jgi:hypothetical protein
MGLPRLRRKPDFVHACAAGRKVLRIWGPGAELRIPSRGRLRSSQMVLSIVKVLVWRPSRTD